MTFLLRRNVSKFSIFSFFSRKCVYFWYCFHLCRKFSIKLKIFISWYNVWFKSVVDHPPPGTRGVFTYPGDFTIKWNVPGGGHGQPPIWTRHNSIATKLGRQVDGVDIYKLEQKIHNGAHIVLPSALFSFCKETPWYTLTQFRTSSFWGLSWSNQPKWMRALDSAFNLDENTT